MFGVTKYFYGYSSCDERGGEISAENLQYPCIVPTGLQACAGSGKKKIVHSHLVPIPPHQFLTLLKPKLIKSAVI